MGPSGQLLLLLGSRRRLRPLGAIALLAGLLIVCRGPDLVAATRFNADEAELLANARNAAVDLTPYRTYTSSTLLALSPMVVGILARLGVPMVLQTAHVLSGLAYLWISFAVWYAAARRLGWLPSAILVLPTAVVLFIGPANRLPDFRSLGTELLPISLVVLGGLVLFATARPPDRRRLAFACVLAGLAVWAKPQALILAVGLCAIGVVSRRLPGLALRSGAVTDGLARDLVIAGAAFAAPTVGFLAWILLAGTLDRFNSEPLAFIATYLGTGVDPTAPERASIPARATALVSVLAQHPAAFAWLLPGLVGLATIWKEAPTARVAATAVVALPLIAAVLTLGTLFPILGHYANFLYGSVALSGIAGVSVAQMVRPVDPTAFLAGRPFLRASLPVALVGLIAVAAVARLGTVARNLGTVAAAVTAPRSAGPAALSTVGEACPPGARVLVWGWASELYAEFDWQPASRYVYSWPLFGWGRTDHYSATMIEELRANPPACVIEALGPSFFGLLSESDSITEKLPAAAPLLARCYVASREDLPGDRPVTLWRLTADCGST